MTTVGRIYRFRAIHSLPDFPEPWCFPHQHDYTVEITAAGGTSTDDLDAIWKRHASFDGCDLNERFQPSTVETIAERLLWTFGEIALSVRVWEDQARWGLAER